MMKKNKKAEESIKYLRACQKINETEGAHWDANQILCDLLIFLGFENVVNEWRKVKKWYS